MITFHLLKVIFIMQQQTIILCIILLGFSNVFAQQTSISDLSNPPTHEIQLSVGYNRGYLKDVNLSPLQYTEGGLIYSLDYTKASKKIESSSRILFI